MIKRKIEKRVEEGKDDFYVSLKPLRDIEGWEKQGRRYNQKGLASLLETKNDIEFILTEEVKQDIETYKEVILGLKRSYLMK